MTFWSAIRPIIRESDVVLLVCDARMPELSRNHELEKMIDLFRKDMIIVFNKIDLVSPAMLKELREEHPKAFFVAGIKNIGINKLREHLLIAGKRKGLENIKIGIVGYPNVGKSSIINALARRARAAISSVAGTTKGYQFIKVSGSLKVMDTPGVIPFDDGEKKLGLIAAKNPEKLKNPERVAYNVIQHIRDEDLSAIEKTYGIKAEASMTNDEILIAIGKRKGFLKKGGIVDEIKSAIEVVRDWQKGKITFS